MRWTEEEAKAHGFKKDKNGNWRAPDLQCRNSGKVSKLESDADRPKANTLPVNSGPARSSGKGGRCSIVVTAYYRRAVDPDNLCAKWFIDQLKEQGVIPDDSSTFVHEVVKRVQVIQPWEPEVTLIEVFEAE